MSQAIAALKKIVNDYIDEDSRNQFIAQAFRINLPLHVAKRERVFSVTQPVQSEARNKFESLKSQWQHETEMLSSITKKIKHPAYQEIITMGEKVVPFILEDLSREPNHWFYALRVITKADPVSPEANFEQAVADWLNWGKNQGYIE